MKIIMTGASGLPGRAIRQALEGQGHWITRIEEPGPGDVGALQSLFELERPDAAIHILPYTDAAQAETEPEVCVLRNAGSANAMARASLRTGTALLLLSDVTVFGGGGDEPWKPLDRPNPRSVRGLSVLQAEEAVRGRLTRFFIVRTGWLWDRAGFDFGGEIQPQKGQQSVVRLPGDWVGSLTCAEDLADFVCRLIATDRWGIYHAANEGFCSRAEAAQYYLRLTGAPCTVIPEPAPALPPAEMLPLNARLSTDGLEEAGFDRWPGWQEAMIRRLPIGPSGY